MLKVKKNYTKLLFDKLAQYFLYLSVRVTYLFHALNFAVINNYLPSYKQRAIYHQSFVWRKMENTFRCSLALQFFWQKLNKTKQLDKYRAFKGLNWLYPTTSLDAKCMLCLSNLDGFQTFRGNLFMNFLGLSFEDICHQPSDKPWLVGCCELLDPISQARLACCER